MISRHPEPNAKTEAGERTVDLDVDLAAKLWTVGADATGPMFHTRTGRRLSDRNLRRVLARSRIRRNGATGPSPRRPWAPRLSGSASTRSVTRMGRC